MTLRELGGTIHRDTLPHRALRNEVGWIIPTHDHLGGAAQAAQVARHRRPHFVSLEIEVEVERDGKPSLKGREGVSQRTGATRTTAMESTVLARIRHYIQPLMWKEFHMI